MSALKRGLSILVRNPLEIINNPFTAMDSIVAMVGGLMVDRSGSGYLILLAILLLLLVLGMVVEIRKMNIYQHRAIPVPVVINIANPSNSGNAIGSLFDTIESEGKYRSHRHNLSKYLDISRDELIFNYNGDIYNKAMLLDFLKIVRHDIEQLKRKAPKSTTIYLAYIGPASVAILVGTLFVQDGVKIFQYDRSSESYQTAIDVNDRALKEDTDRFEKFDLEEPSEKKSDRVTVAIDAAAHKIKLEEDSIKNYGDIYYLKTKSNGTIDKDEDWLQYCREVFKVLNLCQQQYQEIRVVYSMPVALGILLGMAAQNYWNVMLTNYDSQSSTYKDVVRLNEVVYFSFS